MADHAALTWKREGMTTSGNATALASIPLSFNHEFLRTLDAGDGSGPFGPHYHIETAWRLAGPVDPDTLRAALADVVARHEALRSVVVREGTSGHQLIFPPSTPELDVRDGSGVPPSARPHVVDALLTEIETASMRAAELPHVRALLVRFDKQDSALFLATHHLAADGLSLRIIARDLAACYAARRSGREPDLPPMRPYRDFVAWERQHAASEAMTQAIRYWREKLQGAAMTLLPTDYSRLADLPEVTLARRFLIEAELIADVSRVAKSARCTPYMVMLTAYYQLLRRLTGLDDLVIPTLSLGRRSSMFNNTVGSFFIMLPLRMDLTWCRDAAGMLNRTRETCIGLLNYEIPSVHIFEAAPHLMASTRQEYLAVVPFQVHPFAHVMDSTRAGDLEFTEVLRRLGPVGASSQLPDGGLWTLSFDPSGGVNGTLRYRTDLFSEQTVLALISGYQESLRDLVADYFR
jgi:hypothetical protein